MKKRVFYSWQSDLPNNTNRGFINAALTKAIDELKSDDEFSIIPFLDRDTQGLVGSPDIVVSIFDKIRDSSVFVCDVSIVNGINNGTRPTPNPNVLIELGFAISHLGWPNIIMIMNEEFGRIENLPFDLKARRVLSYKMAKDTEDKTTERNKVSKILKESVKEILLAIDNREHTSSNSKPPTKVTAVTNEIEEKAKAKFKVIINITNTVDRDKLLKNESLKFISEGNFKLAIVFISGITNSVTKNELLEEIAKKSISLKDFSTTEIAISGITNSVTRNQLNQLLVESM